MAAVPTIQCQGLKSLHQKKALDGRRYKQFIKFRAKQADASNVLGEVAEANGSKKVGETVCGSSDERTWMVPHQTQETCSCNVMQIRDTSGVILVKDEETRTELEQDPASKHDHAHFSDSQQDTRTELEQDTRTELEQDTRTDLEQEPTSKHDHTHFSDSQQDIEIESKHKRCINCGQGGKLLCCVGQGCSKSFHLSCVNPPFTYFPPGVWHCIWCVKRKMELGVYTVSEGIEDVLSSEWVSTDGAMQKKQYLVKYKGLAHAYNCWIPEAKLLVEAPILFARYKKKASQVSWKKQWSEPERLLAKRLLLFPDQCSSNCHEHDLCRYEWLVKWTGLGYDKATWELENAPFLRSPKGMKLISDFRICHERVKGDEIRKASCSELVELPFGDPDELIYVNKLRKSWHKNHNALIIDAQERVLRVVLFVLSLLKEISGPLLIITTSDSLSVWESEFHRWAANANLVYYKGSRDVREIIRTLEFYNEGGSIMFQVLLSPSIAVAEDLEDLKPIEWEAIVVDECQRPTMSVHLEQIKMLVANMRLLLVSSQIKDWSFNYLNVLSLLDPKYDGADEDLLEADISNLKSRLVNYIAYECNKEPVNFMEFWVPVMLTDVQIEQYCASLLSNSMVLCSYSKSDAAGSINDILKTTRKCCDHPYLVDRSLRNLVLQGKPVSDHFEIEIQMSGKLQLLNRLLPEIKGRGLRVVILFQAIEGSGKISIGDILDDFIHQKFGRVSYARIDGAMSRAKKKAALDMFNNKDNGNFVCLVETRACLPSTKLSSVDTVIIFNSDWDPVNDLKALQKITINSQFKQLKIFRFYSTYTVEEKVLVLAKEGVILDSYIRNIKQSTCQKLLTWGAACLFSKLDCSHELSASCWNKANSFEQTLLEDVFQELSALLPCSSIEHGSTCCSGSKNNSNHVLRVQQSEGSYYGKQLSLIGELKTQSMCDLSTIRQLIEDGPARVFWTNLLKGRKPRWKYMSSSLQGKRKFKSFRSLSEETEHERRAAKQGRIEANSIHNQIPNRKLMIGRRICRGGNKKEFAGNSPNSAVKRYRNVHNMARNVLAKGAKKSAAISRVQDRKVHCHETSDLCTRRPVDGSQPDVRSDHSPVQSSSLPNELPVSTNSVSGAHEEADCSESRGQNDHGVGASYYEVQATTGIPMECSTRPLSSTVQQSLQNLRQQPAKTRVNNQSEPDAANLEQANISPDFFNNRSSETLSRTCDVPQSACVASLQREMERIQDAQKHAIKFHEDLKLHLKSDCEKELEKIHKKYDLLLHSSEVAMAQGKSYLDSCYQLVYKQKLLAESIILKQDGNPAAESQVEQEANLATFFSNIYQSCFRQPDGRTISRPYPPGKSSPLLVNNLSAVPQATVMNPAMAELDLTRPQTSLISSTTSVEEMNCSSAGMQFTSAILSSETSSSNLPIGPSAEQVMIHSSAVLQPGTGATSAHHQSSTSLAMTGSYKTQSIQEHTSILSTNHAGPPSIANIHLSGKLHAGRQVRAPAPHLRHSIPPPVDLPSTSWPC